MPSRENLQRWRYNVIPDHLIGEVLSKRWADNAIPFLAMVAAVVGFGLAIPGFFKPNSLVESTRQLGEFSIVVTGLTVVILAGGIDLSVSSIFALSTFAAVSSLFIFGLPVWVAPVAAIAVGAAFGAVNGYLIGFLRLRAFLTTLVTLVIGRALYDILIINYAARIQQSDVTSELWDWIGDGKVLGLSISVITEIRQFIGRLADEGLAVVVISSYLPEIIKLSDRILVCRQGRVVEEISPLDATEEKIMYAAVH